MEKLVHHAELRVFVKEAEDHDEIKEKLLALIPFDLEQEKIKLKEQQATGFSDKKINILEIFLDKQRHLSKFIEFLKTNLDEEQKALLINQANSRLDDDMCFFIRFDKERWLEDSKLWITDDGYCFHLKLTIAAYPAKKEKALETIKKIFK